MAHPDELIREAIHAVDALAQRATVPFIVEKGDLAESFGSGTLIEVNGKRDFPNIPPTKHQFSQA